MSGSNTIIVPTDFSEVCDNAIHQGAHTAKKLGYKLVLLHVIDKKTKSELKKEHQEYDAIDNKLKQLAASVKSEFPIQVDTIAKEGSIFTTIAEVAEEIKAELMFLGTHGKVGMQHITGSFAFKVVTSSPCPTIVVQNRKLTDGFKNIVFPIQETDYVRQKVQWTLKVAKTVDATIHLFVLDTIVEKVKSDIKVVIAQLQTIFRDHNVKFEIAYSSGTSNFTAQTLKYAENIKADIIMIMSRIYLFDFIITPAEEKLFFNDSEIPIMCVNPREMSAYRLQV